MQGKPTPPRDDPPDVTLGTSAPPTVVEGRSFPLSLTVSDAEAIEASRSLARYEGIFCGISSGGTFAAALKIARDASAGCAILAMLPDTGERYLSTALFEGISDGSDPEP